jgi:hypothetical protein
MGTMTYSHTKPVKPGDPPQTLSVTFDMSVKRESDGTHTVTWANPRLAAGEPMPPGLRPLLERMEPPITFDDAGHFVRTPPGWAEAELAALPTAAGDKTLSPQMRDTAVRMLDARVKNFWNTIVETWLSRKELVPGSTYPIAQERPAFPGLPPLKYTGIAHVGELKPCKSGSSKPSCIEIDQPTSLSPSDFAATLQALAGRIGGDLTGIAQKMHINRANYRMRVGRSNVAFTLFTENAGDKQYWSAAGGGFLAVGLPRTTKFSVKMDF